MCGNCLCNFSLTLLFSFIICIISCTAVVVAGAAVAERRTTAVVSVSWDGHRDGTGSHVVRGNFALHLTSETTIALAVAAAFAVVAVASHCYCTGSNCGAIGVSFFLIPSCVCECLSRVCCGTRELKTFGCHR
jgi:hypothetical protein